jgi:hypothetical protein
MEMEFNIYFSDLKEDCQKRLLEFYGIKTPEEMNLDIFPITTLYREETNTPF